MQVINSHKISSSTVALELQHGTFLLPGPIYNAFSLSLRVNYV